MDPDVSGVQKLVFEDVIGVENVVSGYSGGNLDNPTYNQVVTGNTNHVKYV